MAGALSSRDVVVAARREAQLARDSACQCFLKARRLAWRINWAARPRLAEGFSPSLSPFAACRSAVDCGGSSGLVGVESNAGSPPADLSTPASGKSWQRGRGQTESYNPALYPWRRRRRAAAGSASSRPDRKGDSPSLFDLDRAFPRRALRPQFCWRGQAVPLQPATAAATIVLRPSSPFLASSARDQ